MILKIAAAQMTVVPDDCRTNYETIERFARQAHRRHCQFLCLPEYCWVGPDYREHHINEISAFVKEKASALAKRYSLYLIAGTTLETHAHDNSATHTHNFCYVFAPDGSLVGRYAKRHPVPSLEHQLHPGNVHRVFETEYGKIGIQICRDVLYPEETKVIADLGAKIIFSPAFWSKFSTEFTSSVDEFHAIDELQMIKYLVPARALENSVIFVFCNPSGMYKKNTRHDVLLGYTQVCQPFSGIVKIAKHNNEQLLVATIDTDVVEEARRGWKIRGH